ncbi:MAG: LptF/LptG family permease [Pseudomonadota bacterium]
MRRLDIYLLKQCVQVVAGLTALALAVLLLERLLRIFELVSNTSDTMGAAARMLLALIPYYLSLAIPVALFLGVLITVDRVSRTGELSASLAAGVSLFQVARPFMIIAGSLAFLSFLVMGFLNPLGRYDFRATEHRVQQSSFEAAFQEGKFAQIGDRVFWTEDRSGGDQLGQVFILEEAHEDVNARLTTAPSGRIGRGVLEDETRITLNNGQAITFSPGRRVVERLDFDRSDWNVEGDVLAFRARGDDERELTLPELVQEAIGRGEGIVEPHVAASAAHAQLGRSLILVFLPLIALPMGLGYGRSFQSTGIAVGLVFLLISQKSLETGQTLATNGQITPWLGTWPVVGGVALIGLFLFLRSALRVATPPLMLLSFDLEKSVRQLASWVFDRARAAFSTGGR